MEGRARSRLADHRSGPLFITQRPAGAGAGVRHPIGIFVRLRLGIAIGFTSEQMAAFRSEKVAGFVGIRMRLRHCGEHGHLFGKLS